MKKNKKSGIYLIQNKVNDQVYVGSSIDLSERFRAHKNRLKVNKHHNRYLQNAWNKYGENNFEFIVLTEQVEFLRQWEQLYIDMFEKFEHIKIYNLNKETMENKTKISISTIEKMKCRRHSQDIKDKISKSLKGRIPWNKGLRKSKNVVDNTIGAC